MTHYNNIIQIYDRMVEVSDQLHERNDPDTKGFDKALFMLCHALKQFEGINLHIENRNLTNRLDAVRGMIGFRDANIKEHLKLEDELRLEVRQLKNNLKVYEDEKITGKASSYLKKIEIDFEGTHIEFMSDIDQHIFTNLFMDANKYVYKLKSRKKKTVRANIIKDWYMNFYRERGFKCISVK